MNTNNETHDSSGLPYPAPQTNEERREQFFGILEGWAERMEAQETATAAALPKKRAVRRLQRKRNARRACRGRR